VDDLGYLSALIDEAVQRLNVDPERVYAMGLSNGGFMVERLACDAADRVAGVVNVSGSGFLDAARCQPSKPVTYIRLHSTTDATIPYEGRSNMPGAAECVQRWRSHNGCEEASATQTLDLDLRVDGAETSHEVWRTCRGGAEVHFYTMEGALHVPTFSPEVRLALMEQLMGAAAQGP
jgi:polyhydroxybutyrate depolymerase